MGLEKINEYKKSKNLTNKDISEITGISISSLDKITSGNNANPKLETVKMICGALGCKLSDLLDDDVQDSELTSKEIDAINKYRSLDHYGKEAVTTLLEIEFTRCLKAEKPTTAPTITVRSAARSNDGSVAAGTTTITEEQLKKLQSAPTIKDL